jgi:hypothetical protein
MPEELLSVLTAFLVSHGILIVSLMVLFTLTGLVLQSRRQNRNMHSQIRQMSDLQDAIAAYGQSLIAARTLLERMEHRISDFTDRNLEIQSQFAFNRSFEEAARLVKDGGTVESLVSDCGLSDAEAALMVRLHQRNQEKPRQQWRAPSVKTVNATVDDAVGLTTEEIRLKESILAAQSR